MADARAITATLWSGLGGDPGCVDRLTITGPTHVLPSVFPVTAAATAAVATATLAAAELWRARGGPVQPVAVDSRHAALACRSEHYTEVVGRTSNDLWGPVSGVYSTQDGWIRLHANFSRHREAALRALALGPTDTDADVVRAAVARWKAEPLEEAVYREGGCAGALRSLDQWQAMSQAAVVRSQPLVGLSPIGRGNGERASAQKQEIARPLTGLRVLDLTRVIAGPVAARFLAAYGAEVLRIDAPDSDDEPQLVTDTTVGKRSALLDLRQDDERKRFETLVRQADVILCAYRPGAIEDLGYDPATLAGLRPGLVVGVLSAYGGVGPWGTRRGFDSLVQMTTGIADEGRRAIESDTPHPLPCQLLDHATGYLMAAGILTALTRRRAASRGGGWLVQTSLARTSCWLDGLGRSGSVDVAGPPKTCPDDLVLDLHGALGHSRHVSCPGLIVGAAPHWTTGPVPLGNDDPTWH